MERARGFTPNPNRGKAETRMSAMSYEIYARLPECANGTAAARGANGNATGEASADLFCTYLIEQQ